MDLGLEVTEHGKVAVLGLRGEVDVSTAPRLRQQLVELATEGRAWVVVDLGGVEFLDSTGLGVLVSGLRRFRLLGGDLIFAGAQGRMVRVLEITRLDQAFDVFESVEAAVGAVAPASEE